MTSATSTLVSPNVISELYNITVICTIHAHSTADHCIVIAMADGRVTRTGKVDILPKSLQHCSYVRMCMYVYVAHICTITRGNTYFCNILVNNTA